MSYWLIPIKEKNWKITKEKNLFGVRTRRELANIKKNDYLIFYVMQKECEQYCKRLVGIYQVISDLYKDNVPTWPDEHEQKIKYPFKIRIKPVILGNILVDTLIDKLSFIKEKKNWGRYFQGIPANGGQPLPDDDVKIILDEFRKYESSEEISTEERPEVASEEQITSHEHIVLSLMNVYQILGYYPVREYKANSYEIDIVLWQNKRLYNEYIETIKKKPALSRSFPIAAIEVQVHGNIDSALSRLKHAYDLWKCKLFLVLSSDLELQRIHQRLGEALSGAFHEIRDHLDILKVDDIIKLSKCLNEYKDTLKKLIVLPD